MPDPFSRSVGFPAALAARFAEPGERATGRLSTLYRAREGARTVAVKVLHRHVHENPSVRRRLRREVATTRRLSHPAVLRIDDLIETDEVVALVMEFVEGRSVRERAQQEGPMSWEEARPLLEQLLEGLQEAHDRGIWHRDLNAEHVLLTAEGAVKIVGFGMARVDELVALTMHTRVLGSLDAMAPERVLGMDYDARADLYSVGAVAYELLLGHPPADGTMAEAFRLATEGGAGRGEAMEDLPAVAQTFLERALTADPGSRFATAAQMIRALKGDYDEALWRSWDERQVAQCPVCEAPEVEGLKQCLECGYEFKRLVQSPGAGSVGLRVVTPKLAHQSELWFEKNMEPDQLSRRQVRALMDLLEDYEDVAIFADGGWEYRHAPYFLLTDLELREGMRIQELLKDQGVPSQLVPDWRRNAPRVGEVSHLVEWGLAGWATVLYLSALVGVGLARGVPLALLAAGMVLFFVPGVLMRRIVLPGVVRSASSERKARHRGNPIMIPTESLRHAVPGGEQELVPPETAQILRGLTLRSVQREINELLALSVGLAASQGVERVRRLNQGILGAGQILQDRLQRLRELDPAAILSDVERLQARSKAAEARGEVEQAQALFDEQQELRRRLEQEDSLRAEVTALQGRLLAVRASLLDLRGRQGADELLLEEELGRLDELMLLLSARGDAQEDLEAELEAMALEVAR